MSQPSFLWIGQEEDWSRRTLHTLAGRKLAGSTTPQQLQDLTATRFDFALIEDDEQTEEILRSLRRQPGVPPLFVVSRTADASRSSRLESAGADAVLSLPRSDAASDLSRELASRLERVRAPGELPSAGTPGLTRDALQGVVVRSAALRATLDLAARAAKTRATVLLSGETGTGKEVVARTVHALGPRASRPFVAVNCAAFPETLLESELFGHRRGAFTGATRDKTGLLELADGGTFFLDEIGETSGPLQAKLLRVLQERELLPLGATRTRAFDARVLAASNRDLLAEAHRGQFRLDLYYRLAVFPIHVPPLRQRSEDILPLARHFLASHGASEGRPGCRLSPAAERVLLAYDWPGNVRELENEMQRALAMAAPGEQLGPNHLSGRLLGCDDTRQRLAEESGGPLRTRVAHFERLLIADALTRHHGNRTTAARELGLSREGLHKKMKRLALTHRARSPNRRD